MIILNPDVANTTANLSEIPAFVYEGKTVYWNIMSKVEAKEMYDHAMGLIDKYHSMAGSKLASEILGALEDTYPDWVEEFENA